MNRPASGSKGVPKATPGHAANPTTTANTRTAKTAAKNPPKPAGKIGLKSSSCD